MNDADSEAYREKKRRYSRMLTIYGRKPVLEALQDHDLKPYKLHLAQSNKPAGIIKDIEKLAQRQKVPVEQHDRLSLSRISKNGRQDQGVALDLECEGFADVETLLAHPPERFELLALDSVTNPQNLGMIIRSVCASPMLGLLLPERGCARLDALVIKASAGTLFKARLFHCRNLAETLHQFRQLDTAVYGLAADAPHTIGNLKPAPRSIYLLGNETEGVSAVCRASCSQMLAIPMHNGVESLNVSVAAALIAFRSIYSEG